MSCTDLRLVGRSQSAQLKRDYSMKKSRSLSLTNISNLRKNNYDHVESKVKRYIQQMKETNGQKITNIMSENISDELMMNIDTNVISQFTPSSEKHALAETTKKVKMLTNNPKNLEDKVEYISNNPEAVYGLLCLLFEERQLRYEQDMTMKTLQLNYDNLLAKYAHSKNSIDSFRLSQEVLTDMKSNSSFLSSANYSTPDIKKAFSTPDLSMIDMSSASDMLVKTSYVPVVDPNLGIKLFMANTPKSNVIQDNHANKFENSSSGNLKAIWIHIFKNLREKLKKCILLEKNLALEGEDKKVAWNSIHNDFKCLNDIANYQEDVRKSFGADLEDVKFAIHKYSIQFLGSSLILNDYHNIEQFPVDNRNDNHLVTSNQQIRPDEVQTSDKITTHYNRDQDSGCLTSDCSPHHSLNDSKRAKPYYTTSNNFKALSKHSEDSADSQCNDSLRKSDEQCYSDCSTSSSMENRFDSYKSYSHNVPGNLEVRGNARDAAVRSTEDVRKRRKYSSHFVQMASTPDSSPPSSRQAYDLTRLENNSHLLTKQLKGKGLIAAEGRPQRQSQEEAFAVASSASYGILQAQQMQHKSYRPLRKHKSMQSIPDGSDEVFEVDFRGIDQFFTSTPKKNYRSGPEASQPSTSRSKCALTSGKERASSTRNRSKSFLRFGRDIKDLMEMTESLKIQSRHLLSRYKKHSDNPCKKGVKSETPTTHNITNERATIS